MSPLNSLGRLMGSTQQCAVNALMNVAVHSPTPLVARVVQRVNQIPKKSDFYPVTIFFHQYFPCPSPPTPLARRSSLPLPRNIQLSQAISKFPSPLISNNSIMQAITGFPICCRFQIDCRDGHSIFDVLLANGAAHREWSVSDWIIR